MIYPVASEGSFVTRSVIAIVTLAVHFGSAFAQESSAASPGASSDIRARAEAPARDERTIDFIRAVLGDTEDVWDQLFRQMARASYPRPTMVLVSRSASSACGKLDVSLAPFYCASESRIYADPKLLKDLADRSGDFAAAYIIAREVGQHVKTVLQGVQAVDKETPATQQRSSGISTALEMQADCYAGVWTHFVRKRDQLDSRELEDGSAAAVTVGNGSNDRESAARRLRAFKHGLETGDPRNCDAASLPQ